MIESEATQGRLGWQALQFQRTPVPTGISTVGMRFIWHEY